LPSPAPRSQSDLDRAFVLGITPNLDFAAGALLAGLRHHNPGLDADILILHDGLSVAQQASLAALAPRVRFRPFTKADLLARLEIPATPRLTGILRQFSPLFLAKLTLPDLLTDYDQALWLDADMLIRGDISPVWAFECLTWRPLPPGAFARRAAVLATFSDLRRDPATPLPNGGLVGVARSFLAHATSDDLFALARRLLLETEADSVDELALYLLAASQGIPVQPQPLTFNHPVTAPGVEQAAIAHAIGPHKFWNATPLLTLFPDWHAHHARWVAAGGGPYSGPVHLADVHAATADGVLKGADCRAFWTGVYADLRPHLPPGMLPDLRSDRKFLRLFLAGQSDAQHLRLTRQPNPRKIGLEVHGTLAPRARAALPALDANARMVLPLADLPAALFILARAVL